MISEWLKIMKLPNRLPQLNYSKSSEEKTVYYLQQIIKYDDSDVEESSIIGVYDSKDGDIDAEAQKRSLEIKRFCEANKFTIKPHNFILRKIKVIVSSEVVESKLEHFGKL